MKNPLTTIRTPAPSAREILSALASFRTFYETGQGYSPLGRATFGALCGKLTQRQSCATIVLRSRHAGTRHAMQAVSAAEAGEHGRDAHATPAEPVWDGPMPVYTPPPRRLGGNVRRRAGDTRLSPCQEYQQREGQA